MEVYCDASFAPDESQRKSRSGWIIGINGTPISWKSKQQPRTIAQSTSEAEYNAMSGAVREAIVLRSFINELGLQLSGPIIVHEDNMSAKTIAEEIVTKSSKFIEIAIIIFVILSLLATFVSSSIAVLRINLLMYILTKALPKDTFTTVSDKGQVITVTTRCNSNCLSPTE